jgi:hypothetical protein
MVALTVTEFMAELNPATGQLYTHAEAERKINEMVFGVGYQVDADGKPIEVGKGSALQPTQQHFEALAKEAERAAMTGRNLTPEAIAAAAAKLAVSPEAFAAAVTAAMNAKPPRKKPGRKPKAAVSETEAA